MIIGPYYGEFGWELCCWNPIARYLAEHKEAHETVTVAAPYSSAYLYEFADRFVPCNVMPETSDFMQGQGVCTDEEVNEALLNGTAIVPTREYRDAELADFTHQNPPEAAAHKSWRRFDEAKQCAPSFDVLLALRPVKRYRGKAYPEKEWSPREADRLAGLLLGEGLRVAVIGGDDNHCPSFITEDDYRGKFLTITAALCAAARVVVGPSSGPLHLAQLCGTQVVTWYGYGGRANISSRNRYKVAWNPFGVPAHFIEELQPNANTVAQTVFKALE